MGYYHPNVKNVMNNILWSHYSYFKIWLCNIVWPSAALTAIQWLCHHYSPPCYQATGPAQPLVGAAVGPSHKPPTCQGATVTERIRSTLGGMVVIRWRVRCQADPGILLRALQLTQPQACSLVGGEEVAQRQAGGCVLRAPALAKAAYWIGPVLEVVNLPHIPASVT